MSMFKKAIIGIAVIIVLIAIIIFHSHYQVTNVKKNSVDSGTISSELYTYNNKDSKYSIKYPNDWMFDESNPGTVIFSGKQGTQQFFSTVNIQTILTKKTGGDYVDVKDFMNDIHQQATKESTEAKFLESGPITIGEGEMKLEGEYLIFTYKYRNMVFKQWQIVVMRNDEQVFYAWAYTAPFTQYEKDLPIAKQMLSSWVIY